MSSEQLFNNVFIDRTVPIEIFIKRAFIKDNLGDIYCDSLWHKKSDLIHKTIDIDPVFADIIDIDKIDVNSELIWIIGQDLVKLTTSDILITGDKDTIDKLNQCCLYLEKNIMETLMSFCIFIDPDDINEYYQLDPNTKKYPKDEVDIHDWMMDKITTYNNKTGGELTDIDARNIEDIFHSKLYKKHYIRPTMFLIIRNIDRVHEELRKKMVCYSKHNHTEFIFLCTSSDPNYKYDIAAMIPKNSIGTRLSQYKPTIIKIKQTQALLRYYFLLAAIHKDNLHEVEYCASLWNYGNDALPKNIHNAGRLIMNGVNCYYESLNEEIQNNNTSLVELIGDNLVSTDNILIHADSVELNDRINQLNGCCADLEIKLRNEYNILSIFIDPDEFNTLMPKTDKYDDQSDKSDKYDDKSNIPNQPDIVKKRINIDTLIINKAKQYYYNSTDQSFIHNKQNLGINENDFDNTIISILQSLSELHNIHFIYVIIRNINQINPNIRKNITYTKIGKENRLYQIIATSNDHQYVWDLLNPNFITYITLTKNIQKQPIQICDNTTNAASNIPNIAQNITNQTIIAQNISILKQTLPILSLVIIITCTIVNISLFIHMFTQPNLSIKKSKYYNYIIIILTIITIIFSIIKVIVSINVYMRIIAFIIGIFNLFAMIYSIREHTLKYRNK